MTNTEITELATAIATAVVIALSTPEVAPVTPVTEVAKSEPTAPKKAKKAAKKAPKRTPEQNSALLSRINGKIANATKATKKGATYEEMIALLAMATAITPTGWTGQHMGIARKAEKLAGDIAAR